MVGNTSICNTCLMSYCQCEFTRNPRAEPRQRRVGLWRGGRGRKSEHESEVRVGVGPATSGSSVRAVTARHTAGRRDHGRRRPGPHGMGHGPHGRAWVCSYRARTPECSTPGSPGRSAGGCGNPRATGPHYFRQAKRMAKPAPPEGGRVPRRKSGFVTELVTTRPSVQLSGKILQCASSAAGLAHP